VEGATKSDPTYVLHTHTRMESSHVCVTHTHTGSDSTYVLHTHTQGVIPRMCYTHTHAGSDPTYVLHTHTRRRAEWSMEPRIMHTYMGRP